MSSCPSTLSPTGAPPPNPMTAIATRKPSALAAGPRTAKLQLASIVDREGQPAQVLAKMLPGGVIHSMKISLALTPGEHTYSMSKWDPVKRVRVPVTIITASGYERLNQWASIQIHEPETVRDLDGRELPNPYLCVNDRGIVKYVRVRCVGIGRNAVGNLIGRDLTLTYQLAPYLIQDILAKWMPKGRDADSTQLPQWGKLLPPGVKPDEGDGLRRWFAIDMPDGSVFWIDMTNREVTKLQVEHNRRHLFAERIAITCCRRNVFRSLMAKTTVPANHIVEIVAWPQVDTELIRMGEMITKTTGEEVSINGERVERVTVDGQAVEVKRSTESADPTDGPLDDLDEADGMAAGGFYPEQEDQSAVDIRQAADDLLGEMTTPTAESAQPVTPAQAAPPAEATPPQPRRPQQANRPAAATTGPSVPWPPPPEQPTRASEPASRATQQAAPPAEDPAPASGELFQGAPGTIEGITDMATACQRIKDGIKRIPSDAARGICVAHGCNRGVLDVQRKGDLGLACAIIEALDRAAESPVD